MDLTPKLRRSRQKAERDRKGGFQQRWGIHTSAQSGPTQTSALKATQWPTIRFTQAVSNEDLHPREYLLTRLATEQRVSRARRAGRRASMPDSQAKIVTRWLSPSNGLTLPPDPENEEMK